MVELPTLNRNPHLNIVRSADIIGLYGSQRKQAMTTT